MATIVKHRIDRQKFYNKVIPLFKKQLTPSQKEGVEAIFLEWEERALTDLRWLAYILATAFHETGRKMQPVVENLNYSAQGLAGNWPARYAVNPRVRPCKPNSVALKIARNPEAIANNCYANRMGNGDEVSGDGWKYRGRGLPQTTGKVNYIWAKELTGIDVINDPDLMCKLPVSVETMFEGMIHGKYTGKRLSQYFNPTTANWAGARAIINGSDKAIIIGSYAKAFYEALK